MSTYRTKPVFVEAYQFTGSSTHASVLKKWMESGEYVDAEIHTRDITSFDIPGGEVTTGDYLFKLDGKFYVKDAESFEAEYECATAPKKVPGEYPAETLLKGDKVKLWGTALEIKEVFLNYDGVLITLDDNQRIDIRKGVMVEVV